MSTVTARQSAARRWRILRAVSRRNCPWLDSQLLAASAIHRSPERYLCAVVRQGLLCERLRADGVGQGGAPAVKRGRTTLTNPRAGA